ncbi:MAG: acyl carrier protein [Blastocatellia bacterium]
MNIEHNFDEKILSLIAEAVPGKFKKAKITTDMRLQRDLGIDSLGIAALVFRLEEVFGISLDDPDLGAYMGQIKTVGDAITVSRQIVRQAGAGRS